jgi:Fe-S oxidoreductase
MCGACAEQCPVSYKDHILKVFKALREECVERSLISPNLKKFFENIYLYSNPYRELRESRGKWAEGTGVKQYQPGDEYLYYVGCIGSYDERGNKIAKALGEVLLHSGLSFGILGSEESCDGNEVNLLGEEGLFELLATENIQKFEELNVKKIVTLSPHAYNAMKNDYPPHNGNFEVKHYTQLLRDIIQDKKINISKGLNACVTYHDPCFLGRHNGEYDAPREVLQNIPGIELVEMERNRENSFCCGGGTGNFYTDFLHGTENSPARIRVREAHETGAEILALACPACMTMFEDAVKAEALEEKLILKDISEIVREVLL